MHSSLFFGGGGFELRCFPYFYPSGVGRVSYGVSVLAVDLLSMSPAPLGFVSPVHSACPGPRTESANPVNLLFNETVSRGAPWHNVHS